MAVKATTDVNRIYPVESVRVQETQEVTPVDPVKSIQQRFWQGPERRSGKERRHANQRREKNLAFLNTRSREDRRQRTQTGQNTDDTIGPGFHLVI